MGGAVPYVLVLFGMLGLVAGAYLIGMWAVGCAIMVDSALMIASGLFWPRPDPPDPGSNRPEPIRQFLEQP